MLKRLFQKLFRSYFNFLALFQPYNAEWVEDLPRKTTKNTVYVVGGRKYPFQATLTCPRRHCSQVITLDISPDIYPRWKITEHPEGVISLNPSINLNSLNCNCHYWLKRGRIYWAEAPSFAIPKENKIDSEYNNS